MDRRHQIRVLDDDNAFWNLKASWKAIEISDQQATPFNSFDWLSSWWRHYKKADTVLHLLQFFSDGKLVAIAPMYFREVVQLKLVHQRELCWLGSGGDTSPDYLNVISLPEHRHAVIELFAAYLINLDEAQRINLTDITSSSFLYNELYRSFSTQSGFLVSSITNTLLTANLPDNWNDYRMSLTRKRRKQINHRRNRLDDAGEWSLGVCESYDQRQLAITALEELHRERWISKGASGSFSSDAYIRFHREVIEKFAVRNELWLVTLTLNDKIIGVLYLYHWRKTLYFFQSGFSPDHVSLSPGHVMFTYVISEAIKRRIAHIDLLKGEYSYKKIYANIANTTKDVVYIKPGIGSVVTRSKRFVKTLGKMS